MYTYYRAPRNMAVRTRRFTSPLIWTRLCERLIRNSFWISTRWRDELYSRSSRLDRLQVLWHAQGTLSRNHSRGEDRFHRSIVLELQRRLILHKVPWAARGIRCHSSKYQSPKVLAVLRLERIGRRAGRTQRPRAAHVSTHRERFIAIYYK